MVVNLTGRWRSDLSGLDMALLRSLVHSSFSNHMQSMWVSLFVLNPPDVPSNVRQLLSPDRDLAANLPPSIGPARWA